MWHILAYLLLPALIAGDFNGEMQLLLQRIYSERPYRTVLLQSAEPAHCVEPNLPLIFNIPTLLLSPLISVDVQAQHNSELLAIICVNSTGDVHALKLLGVNKLNHMRDSRVIVIVNARYNNLQESQLADFLYEGGAQMRLLNVVLLHADFAVTRLYYSFTQFPTYTLERRVLKNANNSEIYPDRLRDMYGKVIVTLTDQIEPRTMLFTDGEGRQQLTGYIGLFMRAFARKHNCTLRYPYHLENDQVIYLSDLRLAVRNGSIDVAASLSTAQRLMNIYEYTYPIEIARWTTMLPMEPAVPTYHLMLSLLWRGSFVGLILLLCMLLSSLLTLQSLQQGRDIHPLDFICSAAVLRGLLGQAFDMPAQTRMPTKFIYLLVSVSGLYFTTLYGAQLTNLLTAPPSLAAIASFEDAYRAHVKILVSEQEMSNLIYFTGTDFWRHYEPVFDITQSYGDFQEYRRKLDTRYAYTITTSMWPVFEEQQKYFARRLFRLSPELFYTNFILFALPVSENSPYRRPLDHLTWQVHETGLFQYWFKRSFYFMIQLGRISFTDLSEARYKVPLRVADFYWAWLFYATALSVASVVFCAELMLSSRQIDDIRKPRGQQL